MDRLVKNATKRVFINNDLDIILARLRAREVAREMGFGTIDQARISLATGELARTISGETSDRGEIIISTVRAGQQTGIQVLGIRFHKAGNGLKANGHGTENGRTQKVSSMTALVDEYSFEDKGAQGTYITMMKWLS